MKRVLIFMLTIGIFLNSCSEKEIDPSELVGLWQLSEVLADPGDGSGTFQPVDGKERIIQFFIDGSFKTPGTFCQTDIRLFEESTGVYDTTRNVLIIDDCIFNEVQIEYSYELNDLGELIIYFPCIEPCANKYIKISN